MKLVTRGLSLVALLGVASVAQAAPILYTFTGIGSGTLGTVPFNTGFSVTIPGDTVNVNTSQFGPGTPSVGNLTATIALNTIGTYTLDLPVYVFNNQTFQTVGFGDNVHNDLINVIAPGNGLNTYGLTTAFGPVASFAPFSSQFNNVAVNGGASNLTLRAQIATFQATMTNTAVPEPGSVALLVGAGVGGLMLRRRKK